MGLFGEKKVNPLIEIVEMQAQMKALGLFPDKANPLVEFLQIQKQMREAGIIQTDDKKDPNRRRGVSRGGEDQILRMTARYLRKIEKSDPATWDLLMKKRLGIGEKNPLTEYVQMRQQFKDAGLDPSGEKESSNLEEWAAAAKAFAPAIIDVLNQGREQRLPPNVVTVQPIPQPQIAQSDEPPATIKSGDGEVVMTPESWFLIAKARSLGLDPVRIAEFLASTDDKHIKKFITGIREAESDDDLAEIARDLLADKPEFTAAFAWLRSEGDLLPRLITAIRERPLQVRKTGL